MHISDGALSAPVLAGGALAAAAGVGYGLKKLPWENMMPVALVSSAFFVASLIHVQVGPSSAHLVLGGLMGVMLGAACIPAVAVAMLLQALLLQYGGLTSLGVNICTVGYPAVIIGALFRKYLRADGRNSTGKNTAAAFCCGALAIALTALFVAVALALSGEDFYASAVAVLVAHVPVMLLEGVITAVIFRLICSVAPEMLNIHEHA
ncbi:MAG: Cobalt transport protein CbiM [Desulfovibrio sp.]